jgi:alpha-galactosidase/6-phospho-beta-glucosidase family protein
MSSSADRLKIAVLGAGSFTFGPAVLHDALVAHKLPGLDLALVDPDEEAVFEMADLGRRMATRVKLADATVTAHTEREEALAGASYILCGPTGIPAPATPPPELSNGVTGIAHSVRQVGVVLQLCDDIMRLAQPGAMLLNLLDPLPRTCQVAQEAGVPTVGFCAASLVAYRHLWEILHNERFDHPFDIPRDQLDLTMAGLHHLTFAIDLWHHETGEDLYPRLRENVATGQIAGQPVSARLLAELGYYPSPGDAALRDALSPDYFPPPTPEPTEPPRRRGFRFGWGGPPAPTTPDPAAERTRRIDRLRAAGTGPKPWADVLADRCWERPMDLIAAVRLNRTMTFPAVNVVNQQQFFELQRNVFVEVPGSADGAGLRTPRLKLPESVLPLLQRAARLNDAVIRAARWRRRDLFDEVVDLDPTITEKDPAKAALAQLLPDRIGILSASA